MNVLIRKIPAYYYEKSNLIRLVLFTAFFDLIFINIYKPFSSLTWYPVSEFKFFIFSSLVILTGVLAVAISRVITRCAARPDADAQSALRPAGGLRRSCQSVRHLQHSADGGHGKSLSADRSGAAG